LAHAGIRPAHRAPGVGEVYRGWPVEALFNIGNIGRWEFLRRTFFPSAWWLGLCYGPGPGRGLEHALRVLALAAGKLKR
jgi:hypothetical protein